ncbi:hypothetical protein C0J52_17683 [Blattella germanica]|nr:hypothetical protein C0J52_17683 [Blattella germanica]
MNEEDDEDEADLDNAENQQKASSTSSRTRRNSVRVLFDGLSVVDEETDEEATCDSANSKHKHEQQFFGKIKLPNGKEGVFMSDGMLPNSNGVQPCSWPEQSYYNYTFTPVDSSAPRISAAQENDGFFGTVPTGEYFQRRGGPDVFISGAYPVTASPTSFPVGGNLDQLLKQMNGNENENTVQIAEPQVAQPEGNAQEDDPKDYKCQANKPRPQISFRSTRSETLSHERACRKRHHYFVTKLSHQRINHVTHHLLHTRTSIHTSRANDPLCSVLSSTRRIEMQNCQITFGRGCKDMFICGISVQVKMEK